LFIMSAEQVLVNPPPPGRELNQDPVQLRRRRVAAGYTIKQVAELGVCSAGHLSDLEHGHYSAGPAKLAALARLYSCESVDELMPPAPPPAQADPVPAETQAVS
jgi:transcriptional regulator with XRE-family HTH domain